MPTCQMHQCESTGALWWTMFCTHTTRQGLCKSGRGVFWYPVHTKFLASKTNKQINAPNHTTSLAEVQVSIKCLL